jgi:hypothetical protein
MILGQAAIGTAFKMQFCLDCVVGVVYLEQWTIRDLFY